MFYVCNSIKVKAQRALQEILLIACSMIQQLFHGLLEKNYQILGTENKIQHKTVSDLKRKRKNGHQHRTNTKVGRSFRQSMQQD